MPTSLFFLSLALATVSVLCWANVSRGTRNAATMVRTRCEPCPACGSHLVLLDKSEAPMVSRYCYTCDYQGPVASNEHVATLEWNGRSGTYVPSDTSPELQEVRR